MRKFLYPFLFVFILSCKNENVVSASSDVNHSREHPNIILLYVDDLGYADVGAYGAIGVSTPNIDKLAKGGIRFTDAHSSAATCTPSRFSLLTGKYGFRKNAEVLPGDAPLLIDPEKVTLPKMLKEKNYSTAVIGKWHLGLGHGEVDWNQKISPGANEIGFDYSFLIPATGDRVPAVFVENGKVVNLSSEDPIRVNYKEKVGDRPTGKENPELLKYGADPQHSQTIINGISRIGYMAGGREAEWVDEEFTFVFNEKAKEFMGRNKDKPFFLFYAFHDIHVPRVPNEQFVGKSSMGPRGDVIAQVDFAVGEILKELERLSLTENTLIIFTSDNGPVLNDGYEDNAVELLGRHKPAGPFRGGKYSIFEGGTRVPTIVSWPGTVIPKESGALMSQVDLLASLAALVDHPLQQKEVDSQDHLEAWLGKTEVGRTEMLEEAFTLAIRKGDWKYIEPVTKGEIPEWLSRKGIESGLSEEPQLYDLSEDIAEQKNLAEEYPQKVKYFQTRILEISNQEL